MIRIGQISNRLLTTASFIANSIENDYPMITSSLDDYYNEFESLNKASKLSKIYFLKSNSIFRKLFLRITYKLIYRLPKVASIFSLFIYSGNSNINNDDFIGDAKQKKLFVSGWPYWDVQNFIKHSGSIKKIFEPRNEYVQSVKLFIKNIDSKYDTLVGVHVRRGDYKYYLKGRFYFSLEIYFKKIDEFYKELSAMKKNPIFIICSDEKIKISKPVNFPFVISPMNAMCDLTLLSKCNYIFGPPSTYSMWASFYGNVPYNNFFSKDELLKPEDFSPIIAPSTFANGKELTDVFERYSS